MTYLEYFAVESVQKCGYPNCSIPPSDQIITDKNEFFEEQWKDVLLGLNLNIKYSITYLLWELMFFYLK